jgi:sulfide:quinone oxidoreductase
VVARKGIETHFRHDLVEVRPASKEAVFKNLDDGKELVLKYEMLHVVPPQSAPDVIKKSELAVEGNWVSVHKHTLQHVKFPNVFSSGTAALCPTRAPAPPSARRRPSSWRTCWPSGPGGRWRRATTDILPAPS